MTDETKDCQHSAPNYYGRCTRCEARIQTPSQSLVDYAAREGMTLVHHTATIAISREDWERVKNGRATMVEQIKALARRKR